jgi:predicted dehydrogenase
MQQNEKIKAIIIGLAHMHVNEIALYIHEQPDIDLIGCSDIQPAIPEITTARYTRAWNLKNVSETYNVKVYDCYKTMLHTLKPNVAFILTENFRKPEVVEECAKRGVNVIIEKPFAVSLKEAYKIKESVNKYSIEAIVNWPTTWREYIYRMKNALDKKIVGNLIKLSYINGHTGPLGKGARHRGVASAADTMTDNERASSWWYQQDKGGGVFLDICCYGCMYSRLLIGEKALTVYAYGANLNTPYGNAEDNTVAIIKYPKVFSVVEATWTTPNVVIPSGPILYCTDGVIYCSKENDMPDVKAININGEQVEIPSIEYPANMKNVAWEYAHHIKTGEPVYETLTLERNMEVIALLDTAIESAKLGKELPVPQV